MLETLKPSDGVTAALSPIEQLLASDEWHVAILARVRLEPRALRWVRAVVGRRPCEAAVARSPQ